MWREYGGEYGRKSEREEERDGGKMKGKQHSWKRREMNRITEGKSEW